MREKQWAVVYRDGDLSDKYGVDVMHWETYFQDETAVDRMKTLQALGGQVELVKLD